MIDVEKALEASMDRIDGLLIDKDDEIKITVLKDLYKGALKKIYELSNILETGK